MQFLERFEIHHRMFKRSGGDDGVEGLIRVRKSDRVVKHVIIESRELVEPTIPTGRDEVAAVQGDRLAERRAKQARIGSVPATPVEYAVLGRDEPAIPLERVDLPPNRIPARARRNTLARRAR